MKLKVGITGEGITLSTDEHEGERLVPSSTACQVNPKRSYVYAHYDARGTPFYIGKGTGRRAWDESRHALWHRYVEKHLGGRYTVTILADDLTPEKAESLESDWIAQEAETLVNWINVGRKTDFAANELYHALRNANRELIAGARGLEIARPDEAVAVYRRAIENTHAYASMSVEHGLIGQLLIEAGAETGISGELAALDRLTLCLVKLGRHAEAKDAADQYFAMYRADAALRSAEPIKKRVSKVAPGGG